MPPLERLRRQVDVLAKRIAAPPELLPTFGRTRDFGHAHIEYDGDAFHYVVVERGLELERRRTTDTDDILYWIFKNVTFSLGCAYEVAHRNRQAREDFRRILFKRQIALLSRLDVEWAQRCRLHHANVLADNPFVDR